MFCEKLQWNDARIQCLKNEADLASLSNTKLNITKEYLERVQVRLGGARTLSVGLHKLNEEWKWLDGVRYNGDIESKLVTKSNLAWNNDRNDWILEPVDGEKKQDMYFCEKIKGELLCLFQKDPQRNMKK